MGMIQIRRAILSVSDKTGLVDFARGLAALRVELLASGGTAAALRAAGVPVVDVGEYTGAPEMLDGRVKTLHPKIHGGILARRDLPAHQADLQRHGIGPIDLVVVNLYPFEQTVAQPGVALDDAIEQIDIGGPTLLRAAAKNWRDVVAVCNPADYPRVLSVMQAARGVDAALSQQLARTVFARIAAYDAAISNYLERVAMPQDFPETNTVQWRKVQDMRYGENPHQQGAWYARAGAGTAIGAPLQGKALSYNNILDLDGAIATARDLADHPYAAVVVKHGNPCGVGLSAQGLPDAFLRARAGDPVSAFGGIVAVTRPVDADTASSMNETFFEVICAPGFSEAARALFATKQNLRLVPFALEYADRHTLRSAAGGCLFQTADVLGPPDRDPSQWQVVTRRAPTPDELRALGLAWRVCRHVHSNAIVFASPDRVLGVGAGQMSRLDSVRLAALKMQAGGEPAGVRVAASDAFFPFRDGVDAIAQAGITAIVQPGGSVRDREVIAAADEHGLAMCCTGVRHFKH